MTATAAAEADDKSQDNPELDGIRSQLLELKKAQAGESIKLGELLSYAWNAGAHVPWGFDSWKSFVERELDMSARKSNYLISIYNWFVVKCHPSVLERLPSVGWTKMRHLVGVVDETNVDEWAGRLERGMTLAEVEEVTKTLKDGGEPPPEGEERPISMTFRLFPGQNKTVTEALEMSAKIGGFDPTKRGHLLEMICADFTATNRFQEAIGERSVAKYLAKFAQMLGIVIVGAERDTGRVFMGATDMELMVDTLGKDGRSAIVRRLLEKDGLSALTDKAKKDLRAALDAEEAA